MKEIVSSVRVLDQGLTPEHSNNNKDQARSINKRWDEENRRCAS